MKNQTTSDRAFRTVVAALACAMPLAVRAAAVNPAQAASPCTYVGRLMDAEHVGFDANRVAEIAAYDDATGKKVAESKTFFNADSRRNYALRIPMASKRVSGALVPGATVRIEVTEPNGTVWTGLVVDKNAEIGGPGSVKEVDIVLAECTNEYDLDDYLLDDLYWEWYYSEYGPLRVPGATFNPMDDHDGDGISTRREVLSGTDPFNPDDKFSILSFKQAGQESAEKDVLSFSCRPGRAYSLEVTDSLDQPNWKQKEFSRNESGTPVNYIAIPASGSGAETPKVYLLPEVGKRAFFRIKSE